MSSRRILAAALGLGVAAAGLQLVTAPVAQANAAGTALIVNEVYGGGGSTSASAAYKADFVELYNPTDAALSLNGLSLQYRSSSFAAGGSVSVLALPDQTVASHDHFLVQVSNPNGCSGSACGGADVPSPDFSGTTLNMSASNGQVILAQGTTAITDTGTAMQNVANVVDFVGYGTATSSETNPTGTSLSNTVSVQRTTTTDTDNNAADFGAPATPSPEHSTGTSSPLAATDPGDKNAVKDEAITSFDLAATGGTEPYTWSATGLPPGITVSTSGTVSGTPTAAGSYDVTATVQDSASATDDVMFTITVSDPATPTSIADIQGTGSSAALTGTQTTTGVVTAVYPRSASGTTSGLAGMYIQTPGTGGATDDTPGASDAIFVYGGTGVDVSGYHVGDYLRVTGNVSEFNGLTEIAPSAAGDIETLSDAHDPVTPLAGELPAGDTIAATDAAREAHEGELLAPTDQFTVSNVYSTNQYAEIGLATGNTPLVQPTEVVEASDTGGIDAVKADNYARGVVLDDGAAINFLSGSNKDIPLPWLSPTNPIRVGAETTLHQPVVLDYRNGLWKLQPTSQVTDEGTDVATFENTRLENESPADVGGDIKLGTFNVLNYFTTTGAAYVAAGGGNACTFYNDRAGTPITNNQCGNPTASSGNGPRGAATDASLARQQAKIVNAINGLGADVVSLEEVENSIKLGKSDRDAALRVLVNALNADAGAGTWSLVVSPPKAYTSANVAEQDVIRTAFIYKPAAVRPVGQSDILFGTTAFANAREPLAQAFRPVGSPRSDSFAVVVNHFKSKGDSNPPATGDNANGDQGAFNGDRVRQATALVDFANQFAAARGVDKIFLTGDFNAYSMEDPMVYLEDHGFTAVESDDADDESYSFSGLSGSLDHVLANDAATSTVTGADVWEINADESIAFQYSRYNYNATQFFSADDPFAASDHNPELVGIATTADTSGHKDIQILATNDFHGRIQNDAGSAAAGAAVLAGAVKQLRAENPNTVFAAAGDLIGASTFESFIQNDKPTIDALNSAGLEVSSLGNHELDQGYDDLINRIMAEESAENPEGGAEWQYIAANLKMKATGDPAVPATWMKTMDGVDVGFVGAVTEDLPSLVAPSGIEDLEVTDIVDSVNEAADDLVDNGGADIVVMLVHEGSPSADCATMTNPETTWGHIVTGVDENVDAIVSGHTHLDYNCSFPVAGWAGRPVTERPVVSAGQYGANLNQLVYTVDSEGEVVEKSQAILKLKSCTNSKDCTNYPADPDTAQIVSDAVAQSEVLGAQVLGQIGGAFNRAKLSNGTTENRGGESTLGNLVAEVQRWATDTPEAGEAQIAFMNPGGLRADMVGNAGDFPRDLTYKQAAVVQPFANTLVNMDLTGADIKLLLEQQWQRDSSNKLPSRPFLRLGISKGFTYTYDQETVTETPTNGDAPYEALRGEITGMWLNGEPIDLDATYSVTANSFLASGGDNFRAFNNGTDKHDTGKVDLQAMVDYMDTHSPVPVDYAQHSVGVSFPDDAPPAYRSGDPVMFDLSSLAMSAPGDTHDANVEVLLGDTSLGTFPVTNTVSDQVFDENGTASVDVTLPDGTTAGMHTLTVRGATTGTEVPVVIEVAAVDTTTSATAEPMTWGTPGTIDVTVTPMAASGQVTVTENGNTVATGSVTLGSGTVTIPATALEPGSHDLVVRFDGTDTFGSSQTTITVQVAKAASTTTADVTPSRVAVRSGTATIDVSVDAEGAAPTGTVTAVLNGTTLGIGELTDGETSIEVGPFNATGVKSIQLNYSGDDRVEASSTTADVRVVKAKPKLDVTVRPDRITVDRTRARVIVKVTADGFTPTGFVTVKATGQDEIRVRLDDGRAEVRLDRFGKVGRKTIKVGYEGDDRTESASTTETIRVVRR